eukprot:6198885-Pleurochrysis_carterae.AAC.2
MGVQEWLGLQVSLGLQVWLGLQVSGGTSIVASTRTAGCSYEDVPRACDRANASSVSAAACSAMPPIQVHSPYELRGKARARLTRRGF